MTGKSSWYLLSAAFFLLLNFLFSSVKYDFITTLIYFLFLILIFLIFKQINLNKNIKLIIITISFPVFIYGLIQRFILFPYYLKIIKQDNSYYTKAIISRIKTGRIFSVFSLPTLYTFVISILIIFMVHFLIKSKKNQKIIWLTLLTLALLNLIFAQSLGGIIYLSIGLLAYFYFEKLITRRVIYIFGLLIFTILLITLAMRFKHIKSANPISLRISHWKQTARIINDNKLIGVGLGNFKNIIPKYRKKGEADSIYTHNFVLQSISEFGIPFFIAFLILTVIFLKKNLKKILSLNFSVYMSCLPIIIIYNLIDIGIYLFSAGIITSIILSQISIEKKIHFKKSTNIVLGILLLITSIFLVLFNLSDYYQKNGDFFKSQKRYEQARKDYDLSLKFNPFNYKSYISKADLYFRLNNFNKSEELIKKALKLNNTYSYSNYLLSLIEIRNQNYINSLYYARVALEFNISNKKYRKWYETLRNKIKTEFNK